MSSQASASIYDDGTYRERNAAWHTADSAWKAAQITGILDQYAITPASICDVGCGAGKIIDIVATHFPQARCEAYDTSTDAAAFWSQAAPGRVTFHNTDLLVQQRTFDLILNIDVFEHVDDYLGFLRKLSQHATHFVFHIPLELHLSAILRETHGRARAAVGHLHYFSRETALLTLADTGYDVVGVKLTRLSQETVEGRTGKTNALNLLRKAVGLFSERLSARLFGGYSLLVLARAKQTPAAAAQVQT